MPDRSGKNLLTVLFVLCFSIYAVSPVAGTFRSIKTPGASRIEPGVNLYLVYFVLSGLFDEDDDPAAAGEDDAGQDHIPVKKKRAVVSSHAVRTLIVLSAQTMSLNAVSSDEPVTVAANIPESLPSHSPDLIRPLHSSNAPPVA